MSNNKIYSDYLMHYRTKGSRNGYSKDPNYTPVGEKAHGVNNMGMYGARGIGTVLGRGAATAKISSRRKDSYDVHSYNPLRKTPNRPLTKREQLHENTLNSQMNSNIRSKAGPLRSALFDSAFGGFYDKRTGKSLDTEAFARAMRDDKYAEELRKNTNFSLKRQIKNSAGGQIAADIADRAKTAAKKGRDFADFVVEDNIDRGKKLVNKGKKKVKKLLSKLRG